VAPVDSSEADVDVRELRLALVCYGGVSLAIYMHGITRELQSLVAASNAYERDRERNPFDAAVDTASAYWEALKAAHARDGVRTRVVVDVIAGTSAGGINGVILAKALACDAPQTALRDVWLQQGDIGVLLASRWAKLVPTLPGKASAAAIGILVRGKQAPLSGRVLLTQLHGALERMGVGSDPDSGGGGGWPVELHVTMTDFRGYPVSAPAWDPKAVRDLRHRHHLTFRSDEHHFDARYDRALAFAGRATSSFPGAFPPVRIADIEDELGGAWEGLADFLERFWQPYTVAGRDARDSLFVDGGVLDNAPFDLAIAGLRARPANVEVDRRLLYIEPDPHDPTVPAEAALPTVFGTVWAGLSKIPRAEPVLDQLLALRDFNDRVERADAVIGAIEGEEVVAAPADLPAADALGDEDDRVHDDAEARLGPAVVAYRRLKLYSVLDRLAALAATIANLPPQSNQAFLVHDVVLAWARRGRLLDDDPGAFADVQLPFLRAFDLGYPERRLRFVIRRLNGMYDTAGVERAALDALKRDLYARLYELSEATAGAASDDVAARVRDLFSVDALAAWLASPLDPDAVVQAFLERHAGALDALRSTLGAYLSERLAGFAQRAYATLLAGTEGWPEGPRQRLLSAYLRFPVWDALLFPIRVFGDAGELDRVEVLRMSPLDVRLLGVPGDPSRPPPTAKKLKGVAAGHFGAFFARDRRENDYLWGRLDAVERLVRLFAGATPSPAYRHGFGAVLGGETRDGALTHVQPLIDDLRLQIAALPEES
jgi:patatin-related protein